MFAINVKSIQEAAGIGDYAIIPLVIHAVLLQFNVIDTWLNGQVYMALIIIPPLALIIFISLALLDQIVALIDIYWLSNHGLFIKLIGISLISLGYFAISGTEFNPIVVNEVWYAAAACGVSMLMKQERFEQNMRRQDKKRRKLREQERKNVQPG